MNKRKRDPKWQNNYVAKTYDRLSILVPKGHKATVEAAAKEANESVNQYTNKALLTRMNLAGWLEIKKDD